jgi:hypothetical protein
MHNSTGIKLLTMPRFKPAPGSSAHKMSYALLNAEKALPVRVRKNIEDNRSVLAWYANPTTAKV